eukprot:Rmarinus@m.29592
MNVLYLFSNATSLPHPERSFNVDRALLLGPAGSAKTSLLVQYATSVSAYQGDVIFLTSKMSMRSVHKPRVDVQGSELMTRVHVKYVESPIAVEAIAMNFHRLDPLPRAIYVNDLNAICSNSGSDVGEVARVLGMLSDAADYVNSKIKDGTTDASVTCALLVSWTAPSSAFSSLLWMERWLPLVLFITQEDSADGGSNQYCLSVRRIHRRDNPCRFEVTYITGEESPIAVAIESSPTLKTPQISGQV